MICWFHCLLKAFAKQYLTQSEYVRFYLPCYSLDMIQLRVEIEIFKNNRFQCFVLIWFNGRKVVKHTGAHVIFYVMRCLHNVHLTDLQYQRTTQKIMSKNLRKHTRRRTSFASGYS